MEALILEKEPLALGAYSTRILRRDYQRALMRVRRLADSAQADVRADANGAISLSSRIKVASGSSSATTLGEFVANSAYTDVDSLGGPTGATVTIWYDQSGSNKHMTQTVTNYQPRIVTSGGDVYQADNGPQVLFWPSTPDAKYMDLRDMNGDFTVHLGFRLLGVGTSVKMYDASADTFEISRSTNTISLTNVTSSVTTLNGYSKGSATTIDFSGASDSFVTISGTFSSTGTARIGGNSGGVTDLYIYPRVKDGKRTKKVEAIQSRERSTPLAFSNRQDLDETAFLNTFQGAASAFSLRDLNGSSGTKLISVRRDVDNKEVVVSPDNSGYVSLESPVSWSDTKTTGVTAPSTTVSYATTLGQFLGDPASSDPDSLGTPSNGYVVQMFDQVAQNEASGRRLLDYHTGAEVAYSFKRLSTAYTGAAFEVKAFVGGSVVDTADIQFDSTGNSYANLASYISQKNQQYSGVGVRCSKWYDQSGNSRDLVQAAESNMPLFSISEKNGEVALTGINGILNMSVTGLSIPTPYSYSFSFDRTVAFDGDIISFDTDISVGIASGNYRITSESNVISGGAATAGTMKTIYGVHDGASSEIGVDGVYTTGTGASKAVSSVNLFPTSGFNGRFYEFILWGENKSSDTSAREDIDLYSKDLYRAEDTNAKAIPSTAQPKIYDATNGLITDGGRAAMDVVSGNYFLFDRAKIAGESTVSSFASFSTSDTRGSLYGLEGGYRGPYLNPSYTASGTFLSNFGTPSHFLNGEAETISSSADGSTAISDGVKNVYSLINADASSWTAAGTNDITLFNFNSAASSSDTLIGRYQEFIFFTSDVSEQRESIESNINNAFSGFSSASSRRIPKLLNNFPSSAAAYSVRQINSNYTGPLMRIDNGFTELDIYPLSNGDLDVESILEHASVSPTGNAGVAVWYDQSGSGNDAVQAANSSQPRIAINNAIVYENGKPAVQFDGTDDELTHTITGLESGDFTYIDTFKSSDGAAVLHSSINTNLKWVMLAQTSTSTELSGGFITAYDGYFKNGVQPLSSGATRTDLKNAFFDGGQNLAFYHGTTNSEAVTGMYIGRYQLLNFHFNGLVQESILYTSDQSANRKEIESNINKYFDITPESPKPLLLDKVKEDAAAAYSLRKLRSKYTGPAVRVRRDADDVEVDVYFDTNGEVSLKSRVVNTTETTTGKPQGSATFTLGAQTLGEFVGDSTYVSGGAKNAFVVCWYDQSHNGNDATQNTASNQPKLYDSASGLVTDNGKPAALFAGNYLNSGAVSATGTATNFVVAHADGGSGNRVMFYTPEVFAFRRTSDFAFFTQSTQVPYASVNIDDRNLHYFGADSSQGFGAINGATITTNAQAAGSGTKIAIGTQSTNSIPFYGYIQECVYYNSDQSANRTKIESDINDHYSIYQGSPEPKLLNSYGGAAAAYSLRVLDGIYTGPLVRVRRDSDNIEMDVYPDANGVLSERSVVKNKVETSTGVTVGTPNDSRAFTFGEFAYGTNCYVVEWKDQSGNANHAAQNAAANQPKIYDSVTGVVTNSNGNVSIYSDDTTTYRSMTSSVSGIGTTFTHFAVIEPSTIKASRDAVYRVNATIDLYGNGRIYEANGVADTAVSPAFTAGNLYVHSLDRKSSEVIFYGNGSQIGQESGAAPSNTYSSIRFLSSGNSTTNTFNGYVSELVFYISSQTANRTNIEDNINTFYNIY